MTTAPPIVTVVARDAVDPRPPEATLLLELHRQLDEVRAQLAAVCAEFDVEPPHGLATMRRFRALENVRDLVEQYARGTVELAELVEAARQAGRQP